MPYPHEHRDPVAALDLTGATFPFVPASAEWRGRAACAPGCWEDLYAVRREAGQPGVWVLHRWSVADPASRTRGGVGIAYETARDWLAARPCAVVRAACLEAHRHLELLALTPLGRGDRPGGRVVARVWEAIRDAVARGVQPAPPDEPEVHDVEAARRAADRALCWCETAEALLAEADAQRAPAAAAAADSPAPPRNIARGGRGNANQRMLELLHNEPKSVDWTQRQWADRLGCGPSTIATTPAWQTIMKARALSAADRAERSDPSARTR